MAHRLYYIWYDRHDDIDGETTNRDLFLMAETPEEAVTLWRGYYRDVEEAKANLAYSGHEPDEEEIEGWFVIKSDTMPNAVFTVPSEELLVRKSRAIAWRDIERVDY